MIDLIQCTEEKAGKVVEVRVSLLAGSNKMIIEAPHVDQLSSLQERNLWAQSIKVQDRF
jgi:hypothetical protein